ncbi:hypothetical protein GCM10011504_02730 [Siccirubricoccus deserti]|nr:hypothetical protein GCM10011504_02730 [Siccirubricoccus deserti]
MRLPTGVKAELARAELASPISRNRMLRSLAVTLMSQRIERCASAHCSNSTVTALVVCTGAALPEGAGLGVP